jgi:hypothetical protein
VKLRIGAPDKNRTRDLRFTKPLLYQLSYKGYLFVEGGLEHCPNCGGELKIIAAIPVSSDTKGPEDRLCLAHAKASVPWQSVD